MQLIGRKYLSSPHCAYTELSTLNAFGVNNSIGHIVDNHLQIKYRPAFDENAVFYPQKKSCCKVKRKNAS
jgi:hypothetical protein